MAVYESFDLYLQSCQGIKAKIVAIDAIIDSLLLSAVKAATSDNILEYSLDNGQTIIKTTYKGADQVYKSVQAFRRLRQEYVNMLTGRHFRMVDGKNFNGYGNCR